MKRPLTVAELMTPDPIVVGDKATLHSAASRMEANGIRHLPVVDKNGHVVGILSDKDILRWVGKGTPNAHVEEVMTEEVLTVRPDTLAHEATGLMLDHKIGAVPVIDEEEKLVGILTETDLLRVAHRALGGTL